MIDLLKVLIEVCCNGDVNYQDLVDWVFYVCFLGIELLVQGEELIFILLCNKNNIGNFILLVLYGGVVVGFMEQVVIIFILLEMGEFKVFKIIDFIIDYLCVGLFCDIFVECWIICLGCCIVNVYISVW